MTTAHNKSQVVLPLVTAVQGKLYRRSPPGPFGHRQPEGLTFEKSVTDKKSRLYRVAHHLNTWGPSSKYTICKHVFHYVSHDKRNLRGLHSSFFSLAHKTGFLKYDKKTKLWSVGKRSRLLFSITSTYYV